MGNGTSKAQRAASNRPLDIDLRGYLERNADIVTQVEKPVSIDDIGALSAQSEGPIVFNDISEYPDFRLADIFVKHRWSQARALGVTEGEYLKTLAFRLRQPPRGFVDVATGRETKIDLSLASTDGTDSKEVDKFMVV